MKYAHFPTPDVETERSHARLRKLRAGLLRIKDKTAAIPDNSPDAPWEKRQFALLKQSLGRQMHHETEVYAKAWTRQFTSTFFVLMPYELRNIVYNCISRPSYLARISKRRSTEGSRYRSVGENDPVAVDYRARAQLQVLELYAPFEFLGDAFVTELVEEQFRQTRFELENIDDVKDFLETNIVDVDLKPPYEYARNVRIELDFIGKLGRSSYEEELSKLEPFFFVRKPKGASVTLLVVMGRRRADPISRAWHDLTKEMIIEALVPTVYRLREAGFGVQVENLDTGESFMARYNITREEWEDRIRKDSAFEREV